MNRLLITAERDEVRALLSDLEGSSADPLHIALEQYEYYEDADQREALQQQLDSFQFVVYGGLRNARYFMTWVDKSGMREEFLKKVHLLMNRPEAVFLEEHGIPAILPKEGAKPIDVMEFLLRISLTGAVLYPCADGSSEEMPGLLEELQMPVAEFTVCRPVPFGKHEIEIKREQVMSSEPDAILFHSRGSVIRTMSAFPDLDISSKHIIAVSEGVAHKLRQENLEPSQIAAGSWESVCHIVKNF
jgi:uroporphyrinogen-III synthase